MKIFYLMLSVLLSYAPIASRAEILPPDELIRSTSHDLVEIIHQDERAKVINQKRMLDFIDAKVLPHFDFERMTKLAVGRSWSTATDEQKKALITEFRTLIVRTYAKAFTVYKVASIETKALTEPVNATDLTVKTVILRPDGPSVLVNYEMEKTEAGWKAFDVTVEGISLVATHRGSFAEKVQQSGIDGLIKSLAELNQGAGNVAVSKAAAK